MKNELITNNKYSIAKRFSTALIAAAMCSCAAVYAKDSLYAVGQKQLDNKEWRAAQKTFSSMIQKNEGKQDAALYWLAYAYQKAKKSQKALSTIEDLITEYPESKWVDDALALQAEVNDSLGNAAEITDDEMKLYAIDSLMSASPERATKVLSKIIKGKSSTKIKKRAMFVLSQTGGKDAFKLIADLAKNNKDQQLQLHAVETLGIAGTKNATDLLKQIYQASKNRKIKAKVLDSFMIAGDDKTLIALSKSETDKSLKKQAIKLIGVMDQPDVLFKMYQDKAFSDYRVQIIEGIAISDGYEQLGRIINSEKDKSIRLRALERMGIIDSEKASQLLVTFYAKTDDRNAKQSVIKALFIQENGKALINIAKTEKDSGLKREVIKYLAMIESDEVVEFFSKVLEQE